MSLKCLVRRVEAQLVCCALNSSRRNVLVQPKKIAGIVAALDGAQAGPNLAGIAGLERFKALICEEIDIVGALYTPKRSNAFGGPAIVPGRGFGAQVHCQKASQDGFTTMSIGGRGVVPGGHRAAEHTDLSHVHWGVAKVQTSKDLAGLFERHAVHEGGAH